MLALLFVSSSFAADAPQAPRWQNLQDPDGKILFILDTKDGSIDYHESCEKRVVPQLLANMNAMAQECKKTVEALTNPKKEGPKAPVKK